MRRLGGQAGRLEAHISPRRGGRLANGECGHPVQHGRNSLGRTCCVAAVAMRLSVVSAQCGSAPHCDHRNVENFQLASLSLPSSLALSDEVTRATALDGCLLSHSS